MKYLTMLAIVKSEEPRYLEEWVAHHLKHGVEQVYLLSHLPNDKPIPSMDKVQVTEVPSPRIQTVYYHQALQTIDSRWCLVIDADEFVVCNKPLVEIMPAYEAHEALGIHWLIFGSSGLKNKVFPVHGSYHWRAPFDYWSNRHIKSVVNPAKVPNTLFNPHHLNVETVDEQCRPLDGPLSDYCGGVVRINHYYTKSEEDWLDKVARGRVDTDLPMTRRCFEQIDNASTVYEADPTII